MSFMPKYKRAFEVFTDPQIVASMEEGIFEGHRWAEYRCEKISKKDFLKLVSKAKKSLSPKDKNYDNRIISTIASEISYNGKDADMVRNQVSKLKPGLKNPNGKDADIDLIIATVEVLAEETNSKEVFSVRY